MPKKVKDNRFEIEVRTGDGTVIETINRKPWREACGNFAPLFCRYMTKKCLVESECPHLDDPLRDTDSNATWYIRPRNADGKVVATWAEAK